MYQNLSYKPNLLNRLHKLPYSSFENYIVNNGTHISIKVTTCILNSNSFDVQFFVVCGGCTSLFLDNFHEIHDWVDQKYEKKVLVVIDAQNSLSYGNVMDILRHRIVINGLSLGFFNSNYILI